MPFSRLLRNILSNYALAAVTGLISLGLTPLLFRDLRPDSYAVLVFATSLLAVLDILDLGLASALVRYVSNLSARGLTEELKSLAGASFYLLAGVGVLAAALVALGSPLLSTLFHLSARSSASALALVGLSAAFRLPAVAPRGVLQGLEDFHVANAVDIGTQILQGALTLLCLWLGFGLVTVAAVFPLAGLLRLVGMLVASRLASGWSCASWSKASLLSLKRVWHFSALAFVQEGALRLYCEMDAFLAAKFLSLGQLAVLGVARLLPWGLVLLSGLALRVTPPVIASAQTIGDSRALRKIFLLSTRNVLAVVLTLACALFAWAEVILRLWVGTEVLSGVTVFRVLLVFAVFASLDEAALALLYGLGRLGFSTGIAIAMLGMSVVLGAVACQRGGLPALAAVFALVEALGASFLMARALRILRFPPGEWLRTAVAPVILAELPVVAWLVASYWLAPHTLGGMALSMAGTLALFLTLSAKLLTRQQTGNWWSRVRGLLAGEE